MATILVVDDEPQILRLLSAILGTDHQIIPACNGIEALAVYESYANQIDVILTDVVMPGMSGLELITRLERFRGGQVSAVVMSGAADSPIELSRTLLPKPFSPAQVRAAVDKALEDAPGERPANRRWD